MVKGKVSKKAAEELENFQDEFKKIGTRVRELRVAGGYSSAEKFSNDHGFDRKTYGEWENGKPMSMVSILRVTQAHGITLQEFFKGL